MCRAGRQQGEICLVAHNAKKNEVLEFFDTNPETGLSAHEARRRLEKYGLNKLEEKKKKTLLQRFLRQFTDAMILILIAAAVVSFAVSLYEQKGYLEPVMILLIVILNAVLGVIQESKAEKALDALKSSLRRAPAL